MAVGLKISHTAVFIYSLILYIKIKTKRLKSKILAFFLYFHTSPLPLYSFCCGLSSSFRKIILEKFCENMLIKFNLYDSI